MNDQGGIVCELDDPHFVNDGGAHKTNIGPCEDGNYVCALRNIDAGEELLEDYRGEELDDAKSDELEEAIEDAAGTNKQEAHCSAH